MPDDPVLAPWRRMRRAGVLLFAACALLLPLFAPAIQRHWLPEGIPDDVLRSTPKLLWLGLSGGGLTALLASLKLRRRPPS